MVRGLIVVGSCFAFVLILALLSPIGGEAGAVAAPPGGQSRSPSAPGRHGGVLQRISAQQREALGLDAPTWTAAYGKHHPDVQKGLDAQEKLKQEDSFLAKYQPGRPVGFEGLAYVAVHLRHEQRGKSTSSENQAAIKKVQARVLSKLTAAELSVVFQFKNSAGILGYLNAAGLTKLAKDPDVVAVALDRNPVPHDPPHVTRQVQRPGNEGWTPLSAEKANPEIRAVLEKSTDGYVYVIVCLRRAELHEQGQQQRDLARRELQESVLGELSAADFRLRARPIGLWGYVNAAGLAKLVAHADVTAIDLDLQPPRPLPLRIRKP